MNHIDDGDWFLLIILILAAAYSFYSALRLFHRSRLIKDMPTSKIRSCPQGYVELYGTAKWMQGPEIQAPLSGQPCVWYSFVVEEYAPHSKHKWRRVNSGISDELFLLEDDTGACVVDPHRAEVAPSSYSTWYGKHSLSPSRHTSPLDILNRTFVRSGEKYRYTEKRIDVYESLYAIGEYHSIGTGYSQSLKDAAIEKLKALKRNKEELDKYDTNKDGRIDEDEWEQARIDAKQAAIDDQLSKPMPKRMHILKKPSSKKNQPFIISSKTETQISRKSFYSSLAVAGVFILLSVIIFYKIANLI